MNLTNPTKPAKNRPRERTGGTGTAKPLTFMGRNQAGSFFFGYFLFSGKKESNIHRLNLTHCLRLTGHNRTNGHNPTIPQSYYLCPMLTLRQLFLNNNAQTTHFPLLLEFERAEGVYMYDKAGKPFIDLISGIGVSNLGHSNPQVIAAIKEQVDK